MRLPVVVSFVLHGAVIALAATLPAPTSPHAPAPIEIDIQAQKPLTLPPPPEPEPPKPEPKPEPPRPEPPKVAMRTERHEAEPKRPTEPREVPKPEAEAPKPENVPPANEPPKKLPGKLDLTLHALPGAGGGGIVLPSGPGSGTFGAGGPAAPPRKEWKMRGDAGDPILGKLKDKPEERFPLEKVGPDEFVYKGPQFSAHIAPDGSVSFDDKNFRDFNGTSGTFDLNDWIARGKKEDPYRHLKAEFMKATQAQRDELAKKARAAELAGALAALPRHLDYIWGNRLRSLRERKQLLFALWKEADGDSGAEARAIIEAYIRTHLPEGSPEAYSDDELESLSRNAKARFQPYK